ncbi:hypothetical protein [Cedecea sp. NFIX57]|uniref:hypothetical protein n=1 Tax=Cedecea sp. NFIX57 TaxID=1566286 RepID=UPI000A0AB47C|nr:hypothetical protein [Cedecea sp. NFIX57]SMG61129.1 hypothetical protein SAMN03159353_104313 [Cedecea sp. NFIX57]
MTYIDGFEKNAINISRGPIHQDNGELHLPQGSLVSGWKVEAGIGFLYQNNQVVNEHKHATVDGADIEIFHAARLVYKKVRGNISHTFVATKGQTYTFTWLHIADMYFSEAKHQNVAGSPEYHVHITLSTDRHLDNPNPVTQMPFFASDSDWVKKSFVFTAPESREYCISFQGKYDNSGIDRGAVITQINAYIGDEDDGSDPNKFRVISATKELPLFQGQNEKNLNNPALHFTLEQRVGDDWKVPPARHQLRFDLTEGDNIIFDDDSPHYKITPSDEGKFTLPANCIKAKLVTTDTTKYMTVGLVGINNLFKQIKKVGYSDLGYHDYDESKLPLTLKASASDKWTVDGTVPGSITEPQNITLQLKKNGRSPNAAETLTVELNSTGYLTVTPTTVTTKTDGTFTLTLTPVPGQTGSNTTTLTLKHYGQVVGTYHIKTGETPSAKYEIRVYDADGTLLPPDSWQNWSATDDTYVSVSVVNKGTEIAADANVTIVSSDTSVLTVNNSPVNVTTSAPKARVNLTHGHAGTMKLTFTATNASPLTLNIRMGSQVKQSLVASTSTLWLSAGINGTVTGENAPLEVGFNPQIEPGDGNPPTIHYTVEGMSLHVIGEDNLSHTEGDLHPVAPTNTSDYRVLPHLRTATGASKACAITFSTKDNVYAPVKVDVKFTTADHIKWSTTGPVTVAAGHTTNLKLKLKVLDKSDVTVSTFALTVRIDDRDAGATFESSNDTTCSITSADRDGFVHLPELNVKNTAGTFFLYVVPAGGNTRLNEQLQFTVKLVEDAKTIRLSPNTTQTIQTADAEEGIGGPNYYAELLGASGNPVKAGEVTFTVSASNKAGAKFKNGNAYQQTIPVRTQDGRARIPVIVATNTGRFTLTATSGSLSQDVEFNIV